MYFSTIALVALFAATIAPSPIAAKTVLPNLSKQNAAGFDEDYDCQVHLDTDEDTKATPEELAIFEQALILSANHVYGRSEMHMDKAAVKKAKHGPKALFAVEGGINDNDIGISKNLLRGEAQVEGRGKSGRSRYSTWYSVFFSASCNLCVDRNDFDLDSDAFMDTAFLTATKKGKKGGDKHALWEETLCDLLNQTPAFDHAKGCEIVVTKKGKVEPVLDGAMGVITTEFVDMEEERI
jgi:hypothetical protein